MQTTQIEPLVSRSCALTLLLLGGGLVQAPVATAQYLVEVTFDDEVEGTGPADGHAALDNLETGVPISVALVGGARRSALDAGQYGRAADFPGGDGGIEASGWEPGAQFITHLWLRPRATTSGMIVGQEASFDVGLVDGGLVVGAHPAGGGRQARAFGINWPDDGRFHHVTVGFARAGGETRFFAHIDFGPERSVSFDFVPAASAAPLRIGRGLDGLVDELIVANRRAATVSAEADRFKRWPGACAVGTECIEEVFTMVPRGFPHEVPVRMKTLHDPALCSVTRPCPLVIDISGGSKCANDYGTPEPIAALARLGFVVVTVDPYCEGDLDTPVPGTETSQLIAAKDFALERSIARDLIAGPEYSATGCSHGAEAVMVWTLTEADYPARTFARSAGGSGLCAALAGELCGWSLPPGADLENPAAQRAHERTDFVAQITPELASTRQVIRSWGKNLSGPICTTDGDVACNEEGQWGMTYASRRFRDQWERLQPSEQPTGYFVEDVGADCRHCAPAESEAFRCGACALRHGRAAMDTACPECLSYAHATTERGADAAMCPIDASWYTDPLASTESTAPDGGMPGTGDDDAGVIDADVGARVDGGGGSHDPGRVRMQRFCGEAPTRALARRLMDGHGHGHSGHAAAKRTRVRLECPPPPESGARWRRD